MAGGSSVFAETWVWNEIFDAMGASRRVRIAQIHICMVIGIR